MAFPKMYYIALVLLVVRAQKEPEVIRCTGKMFNGVYYDEETITERFSQPYNLVFCTSTRQLFFSHTIENNAGDKDFAITVYNTIKKSYKRLNEIKGGFALAYDMKNERIFMGGHDGIYIYDPIRRILESFQEKGKSIWALSIQDEFHYIEYPSQKLFLLDPNGSFMRDTRYNMRMTTFFQTDKEVFFSNETALFSRPLLNPKITLILHNNIEVRQIVEDNEGIVYFCASDGIFTRDKNLFSTMKFGFYVEFDFYYKLYKVIDVDQAFGLTFDLNDNLIYSDRSSIYKLVRSNYSDACGKAIREASPPKPDFSLGYIDDTRRRVPHTSH